jgi:hypothetical protein
VIPLAFDMDRVLADVHWLVEDLGPRAPRSPEESAAVKGVIERLEHAGWKVLPGLDSPVACRGKGRRLFLAHVDSVSGSPGALDNAGSVAVLLELARTTTARDLCLGFPVQEEAGLIGSQKLAKAWDSLGLGPLELVVAAEFVGDGAPTAMDLWSAWGHEELSWLAHNSDIVLPFRHHVVGRTMPVWRSDHAPFAETGILSFNLLNRGEHGVHIRYHQPSDDTVDPDALRETAQVFEQLATAPTLKRGDGDPAFKLGPWVLPGFMTWFTIVLGIASGVPGLPRWRDTIADLFRFGLATTVAGLVMWLCSMAGFPVAEAEQTAHHAMKVPISGWWAAAPWSIGAGWIAWVLIWRKLPGEGHPAVPAALLTALALLLGPLFALPFAMAAIAVRIHPLLGLGPAVLWIQPSVLREITFHGLAMPWMWPILFVMTWPAFGRIRPHGKHR